jgi:hypothetical protein
MKGKRKMIAAIAMLVLTIPACMAIITDDGSHGTAANLSSYAGYQQQDHLTAVPAGYKGIYAPEEMNMIGNDPAYPLSGKYILMNDVNFGTVGPNDTKERYTDLGDLTLVYRISSSNVFQFRIDGISAGAHYMIDNGPARYVDLGYGFTTLSDYNINADHVLTVIGALEQDRTRFAIQYEIKKDTITTAGKTVTVPSGIGNFTPIGDKDRPFTGVFDGNGYSIGGLDIWGFRDPTGIFGNISGATVKNIRTDAKITSIVPSGFSVEFGHAAACATGTVVGYADRSSVTNCESRGTIYFSENNYKAFVGGIIGSADSSSLANLEFAGSIHGDMFPGTQAAANVGGITGVTAADGFDVTMTITECSNSGNITIKQDASASGQVIRVGGMVGMMDGSAYLHITDSENSGNLTVTTKGTSSVGGIGGYVYLGRVDGCGNTGEIRLTVATANETNVGGLFGSFAGQVTGSHNKGDVYVTSSAAQTLSMGGLSGMTYIAHFFKCYNEGDMIFSGSSTRATIGGLIGNPTGAFDDTDLVSNCYNIGSVSVDNSSPNAALYLGGITGRLTITTKISNSYNIGYITNSGTQPPLRGIDGITGVLYHNPNSSPTDPISSCFTKKIVMREFSNVGGSGWNHENTYDGERESSELLNRSTYTDAGWDFENIWGIAEGSTPTFKITPPPPPPPPTTIKVSFDPRNGDPLIVYKVEPNTEVTLPTAEYEGHTFMGWYTDMYGDWIEYTGWALTEDTTFYAHWHDDNDTGGGEDEEEEEEEEPFVPIVPEPERKKGRNIWLWLLVVIMAAVCWICIYWKGRIEEDRKGGRK